MREEATENVPGGPALVLQFLRKISPRMESGEVDVSPPLCLHPLGGSSPPLPPPAPTTPTGGWGC